MRPDQLSFLDDRQPSTAAQPALLTRDRVYIGTCGFSYKDWIGPFYPARTKMSDMLRFYSTAFNCVEINSTFYGIPPPERMLKFATSTPDSFVFVIKANQAMTHDLDPSRIVFDDFKRCLAPLERTEKLASVLVQFPQRFQRNTDNENYLREVRERMKDYCVVTEFRHASWNVPETFDLLNELNFHYCCVDEPGLRGLMPRVKTTTGDGCPFGPLAYVRFHGRNAKQWHHHDQAWMRYDYLYSDEELQPWADWLADHVHANKAAATEQRLFTLFNNHAQAKAAEDARRMRRLLGYG